MIGQMLVLLRLKELKQDNAFRAMRAKRTEVEDAKSVTTRARETVEQSAATLDSRENAIYADIIGKVVDLDAIDDTRGRVVQLEKDHVKLTDALERATHVQDRLEKELDSATQVYNQATQQRDKYNIITDDMKLQAIAVADQREEVEIEDLFARSKRRLE
jgi:hypothetical protein